MKYCFYLLISVFIFTACKKDNARPFAALRVTTCETEKISDASIKICMDSVISDSRCPLNAVCVWQGTALARFTISVNGETAQQHELTLSEIPSHNIPSSVNVQGYKISFISLTPYPGEVGYAYNKLKAGLEVIKL